MISTGKTMKGQLDIQGKLVTCRDGYAIGWAFLPSSQRSRISNIFTLYCEAYHHESISQGHDDTPEKISRFQSEVYYMQKRYKSVLEQGGPYYNANLTLDTEDFTIKLKGKI